MKIGIITFQWADNYGAVLQSYALWKYLNSKFDLDVEVINYKPKEISKSYRAFHSNKNGILRIKDYLRCFINLGPWYKKRKSFQCFRGKMNTSKLVSKDELLCMDKDYDLWITGSDQVWNSSIIGDESNIYTLSFIEKSKKISYAASSGNLDIASNSEDRYIVKEVNKLDNISVRESSTSIYLSKILNKNVNLVCDPTLLLEEKQWIELIKTRKYKSKYLLVYFIGYDDRTIELAKSISSKYNLDIVICGNCKELRGMSTQFKYASPEEFLSLFYFADYVIASSFHATIFSIIFKKQFLTITPSYASNRVIDLCNNLDLKDRCVFEDSNLNQVSTKSIDYEIIDKKIASYIESSKRYLEESIIG